MTEEVRKLELEMLRLHAFIIGNQQRIVSLNLLQSIGHLASGKSELALQTLTEANKADDKLKVMLDDLVKANPDVA